MFSGCNIPQSIIYSHAFFSWLYFSYIQVAWSCVKYYAGDPAPLQILVTGRSGSTSCVGDQVTFTCTLPAVAHVWSIRSLGFSAVISRGLPTFHDSASPFTIVTTADGGGVNPITTELSVTSFAGLNGANITCIDANQVVTEVQDTIAMVFGKLLDTKWIIVGMEALIVTIDSPSYSHTHSVCTHSA